jgi:hypothetical protein
MAQQLAFNHKQSLIIATLPAGRTTWQKFGLEITGVMATDD